MSGHESRVTDHGSRVAGGGSRPWYREPWPWILMAGPAAVIVAGAVTIWLAFATSDGLVADDYYRRGLAINRELRRDEVAVERGIAAEVERRDGVLRVRLLWRQRPSASGQSDSASVPAAEGAPAPMELEAVFARLVHATRAGQDQRLRLPRVAPGVYEAQLGGLAAGRWRLLLEDPRGEWRIVKEDL